LEHQTLKVPYEILNKRFRASQKVLDREVNHVSTSLTNLERKLAGAADGVGEGSVLDQLDAVRCQLVQLRDKGREGVGEVLETAATCKRRAEHLEGGFATDVNPVQIKQWRKTRLDRILVEHFLRSGFYNTAIQLAKQSEIEDLTNIQVFLAAKAVEESLQAGDVTACLAWCHENKSKLRKLKSTLEFNVRIQEFIECIRKGNKFEAVKHARKFLSSEDGNREVLQEVMGLLAFPADTNIKPYKDMMHTSRWQALIKQFRSDNFKLHQLSTQSLLSVSLQTGLSCLKTPHCYKPGQLLLTGLPAYLQELRNDRNVECPVCHPSLNTLAMGLPYSHCTQSRLVCYMSGSPLNENNIPMMLPNGYVYGQKSLLKMSEENDGQIVCPRTKEIYAFQELEKVYVM